MVIIDNVLKDISLSDIVDKQVIIPEGVKKIDNEVFLGNESIVKVVFPSTLEEIGESAFEGCIFLEDIDFPKGLKKIDKLAFNSCFSLKNISFNEGLEEIGDKAFSNMIFVDKVVIPESIKRIGEGNFKALDFSYYKDGKVVFSSREEKISKNQMIFPVNFIEELSNTKNIYSFFRESNFSFFNSNFKELFDFWKEKYNLPAVSKLYEEDINYNKLLGGEKVIEKNYYSYKEEMLNFFKFAYLIGCFDNKKYDNEECTISSKSSSLLYRLTKQDNMKIDNYYKLFKNLPIEINVPDNFIKFISHNNKGRFDNIDLLVELEKEYKGIFCKTMFSFDDVIKLRNNIDDNGRNYIVSWKDAIIKNYSNNTYYNVTDESEDIAKLFNLYGLSQKVFEEAKKIRRIYNKNNVDKKILNKELKEEYNDKNKFSYEWLDKSKPENFILGIFCNCCANITSNCYGNNIAIYSILSNNLQNLVVRDKDDNIIGKATVYVNKEKGYAVINDFEINKKYRYGESDNNPGIYTYEINYEKTKKEKEHTKLRLLIFNSFIRGINDFVKEYNSENEIKIKKVNVGMGANRLKSYVLNYSPELDENKLYVPDKYSFEDATKKHQYMLFVS